jgi:methyl-accepting chemotaxis protein
MASQIRTITLQVKSDGTDSVNGVADALKKVASSSQQTASTLDDLRSKFLGLAAVFGVGFGFKQLTDMADSMQLLTDRIKIMSGSSEVAAETVKKIAEVANYTKVPIADLGRSFNTISLATKDLGASSNDVLGITQALYQTYRISGTTAEAASTGIAMLGKGFETGTIKGRELNTMLKTNQVLVNLLKEDALAAGKNWQEVISRGLTISEFTGVLNKHFDELNLKAGQLGQTFGQTLTIAMNKFTEKVGEVSKDLNLNGKFVIAVDFATEHIKLLAAAIGVLTALQIPTMLTSLGNVAIKIAAAFTPLTAIATVIGGLAVLVSDNLKSITEYFEGFRLSTNLIFSKIIESIVNKLSEFSKGRIGRALGFENLFDGLKESAAKASSDAVKEMKKVLDERKLLAELDANIAGNKGADKPDVLKNAPVIPLTLAQQIEAVKLAIGALTSNFQQGKVPVEDFNTSILSLTHKLDDLKIKTGSMTQFQEKLDLIKIGQENVARSFESGGLNLEQFSKKMNELKIEELTAKFNNGKISLFQYKEEILKIKEADLGSEFERGNMLVAKFDVALRAIKLEQITAKFEAGKVSALQYHQEVLKLADDFRPGSVLYTGTEAYIQSSGTFAQNVSKSITLVFSNLETELFKFTKTGKFEFAKFTQAILDDLQKIILRAAIVQPLANGIQGLMSAGWGSGGTANNGSTMKSYTSLPDGPAKALGGAYNNGIEFFANGGVVNSPTSFNYSGGTGVMGEAGPEAIMPLSRDSSGKLGVKGGGVVVNIINNSGSEVTQKQTTNSDGTKTIDVIIATKTKELFSNGSMDKTMQSIYGLSRQGA